MITLCACSSSADVQDETVSLEQGTTQHMTDLQQLLQTVAHLTERDGQTRDTIDSATGMLSKHKTSAVNTSNEAGHSVAHDTNSIEAAQPGHPSTVPAAIAQLQALDGAADDSSAVTDLRALQTALLDTQSRLHNFLDNDGTALKSEALDSNADQAVQNILYALQQHVGHLQDADAATTTLTASKAQARLQKVRKRGMLGSWPATHTRCMLYIGKAVTSSKAVAQCFTSKVLLHVASTELDSKVLHCSRACASGCM